jgi:hypothetical protein
MPKLEYFLVCESISIDQETNRVSVFNIVEEVAPIKARPTGPIVPQVVALACWNREPGDENKDFQATLRIHAPEEKAKDFPVNFKMEKPRYRLSLRLQGVPALKPGQLRFEMLLNGKHAAEHTILVHSAPTEEDP